MKRLTWRDGLATVFVGLAALVYIPWLAGTKVLGMGVRGLGIVVLALGLAASVTAVVYGVGAGLLRASKLYLAIASLVGILALVSGVITLVSANEPMLDLLMVATAVLWAMATVRHAVATETPVHEQPVHESFRDAA
ncbi:MAG: hypothetical protein ACXVEI_10130 [Actinomycetota bacterium]